MKKLLIAVFILVLGLAFAAPSFALENKFGGYWRVRMFTNNDFDGVDDTVTGDISRADTRTRLYYTAEINDNLKFVNKFEMNAVWGVGGNSYGDLGADGNAIVVKNTYADFKLGGVNAKIGTQGAAIHRSFLFDNDFSGVVISSGPVTGLYAKVEENSANAGDDVALWHLGLSFDLDTVKVAPGFTYVDLNNDDDVFYLGLDVDASFGAASVWGTFIYNGGEVGTDDISAFLAAAGGSFKASDMMSIHGQVFYATGDDNATDNNIDQFVVLPGTGSYYWAEIMGYGIFDASASNGSPADQISNITALNLGVSFAPMEKLSCTFDLWYATLNEELAPGLDEKLGTELDFVATYQLVEGLNVDLVGAYLFAGDSTTGGVADDANPWEIGTRFSLSF